MDIILSRHAKEQLQLRGISEEIVWQILSENKLYAREDNLSVYHGFISENGKSYLIRIFINELVSPNLIVTVYKTSKIKKYES